MTKHVIQSPVTGTVWMLERKLGDKVQAGDVIMVLESMKMEIPVESKVDGVIKQLEAEAKMYVEEGQTLCVIQS